MGSGDPKDQRSQVVSNHRLTVGESRPGLLPDQHTLTGLLAVASLPRSFRPTLPDLKAYSPMQGGADKMERVAGVPVPELKSAPQARLRAHS